MADTFSDLQRAIAESGLSVSKLVALRHSLNAVIEHEQAQLAVFEFDGDDRENMLGQFKIIKLAIEKYGMGIAPLPVKRPNGEICWRITVRSWCRHFPAARLLLMPDNSWALEFVAKHELCPDESFDLAWALRESGVALDEWDIR